MIMSLMQSLNLAPFSATRYDMATETEASSIRDPRTWYSRTVWLHRRRDQLQREPL
jgi:hypothetical protein